MIPLRRLLIVEADAELPYPEGRACACPEALRFALITDRARIPPEALRKLGPLVSKYLS